MDGVADKPESASNGQTDSPELCFADCASAKNKPDLTVANASSDSAVSKYGVLPAKIDQETIDFGSASHDRTENSSSARGVEGEQDPSSGASNARRESLAPGNDAIKAVFGDQLGGPSSAPYPNHFVPDSVERGDLEKTEQAAPPSNLLAEKAAAGQQTDLPEGDVKGSIFVRQGGFMLAANDIPLKTSDLASCSALVISDGEKSYLAHIDGTESPEAIKRSLSQLNLNSDKLAVFLLPGKAAKESVDRISQALSGSPALDRLKVVKWDANDKGLGPDERRFITVHNGKIMRGNSSMEQLF